MPKLFIDACTEAIQACRYWMHSYIYWLLWRHYEVSRTTHNVPIISLTMGHVLRRQLSMSTLFWLKCRVLYGCILRELNARLKMAALAARLGASRLRFPFIKLFSLAVRQVSKPLARALERRAEVSPFFRNKMIIPLGQGKEFSNYRPQFRWKYLQFVKTMYKITNVFSWLACSWA